MTPEGEPMSTAWRIPWTRFTDQLLDALRRTHRQWSLDVQPATVRRLGQVTPGSRFLAILCHGNQDGLAFEDDEHTGVWHHVYAEQLSHFFRSAPPDVVLVLACQGAAAAQAIHRAGVPLTVGVDRGHALYWHEAVELAANFFGALGAGHDVDSAVAQAMIVAPRGDNGPAPEFRRFGARRRLAGLPEGSVSPAVPLHDWIARPPTEVFVGRKTTLPDLLNAVSAPGIVHLVGPPGAGKTELSRMLLDRSRLARWPLGGSVFVKLDGLTTAEGLLAALVMARPPSLRPAPGTASDDLGAGLGSSERLIVLDNADDVFDADPAAEALRATLAGALRACPEFRARIVITSTRALPWQMERASVIRVGSLDGDDETRQLLEGVVRGSFVARGGQVDEVWRRIEDHAGYGDLIQSLGRHPLTVVWAGNALRSGTPLPEVQRAVEEDGQGVSALLDHLRQRVERARPGVSRLWGLMAEFPGGLPARTAMLEEDRLELAVLRQHSAFESDLSSWRVPEPVRQYLRRCREAGLIDPPDEARRDRLHAAVADALVASLEEVVSTLRGERGATALRDFEALRPTIAFLLDATSSAMWPAISGRKGRLTALAGEAANYAGLPELAWQWTLGAADDGNLEDDRTRVLLVRSAAATLRYDWATARQTAEMAHERAIERGETLFAARALRLLADLQVYESSSGLDSSEELYRQALAASERVGDEAGIAQSLFSLGDLAQRQYRHGEAVQLYQSAREMHARIGDKLGEGRTLRALGDVALRQGRSREAARRLTEAARILGLVGVRLDQAAVESALGQVQIDTRRIEAAEPHLEAACQTYMALGERLGEANVRLQKGDVSVCARDFGAARAAYERARQLFEATGNARGQGLVQQRFGELALRARRFDEALHCAREAGARAVSLGDEINAAAARLLEARAHRAVGDPGQALEATLDACARARRAGSVPSAGAALELLAELVQPSHPVVSRAIRRVLRESPAGAVEIDLERIIASLRQAPALRAATRRRVRRRDT